MFILKRKSIFNDIKTLIDNVKKNINLEIKDKTLNGEVNLKKNQKEYFNLLIDRYLLKLFDLCDINPADYSKMLIQASK